MNFYVDGLPIASYGAPLQLIFQYRGDEECNVIMPYRQAIVPNLKTKMKDITGFKDPVFVYNEVRLGPGATAQNLALENGSLIKVYEHGPADFVTVHIVNNEDDWPELRNCLVDLDTTITDITDLYVARFKNISNSDIKLLRKGKPAAAEDTLRSLAMVDNSTLVVVGANEVPLVGDGCHQSMEMIGHGYEGDSLFVPETQRFEQRAQIERQLPETPAPAVREQRKLERNSSRRPQRLALSGASQQALDEIKESDAYNDDFNHHTRAYRRSTLFREFEEPILTEPINIVKASDYCDGRPSYVLQDGESRQRRPDDILDAARSHRDIDTMSERNSEIFEVPRTRMNPLGEPREGRIPGDRCSKHGAGAVEGPPELFRTPTRRPAQHSTHQPNSVLRKECNVHGQNETCGQNKDEGDITTVAAKGTESRRRSIHPYLAQKAGHPVSSSNHADNLLTRTFSRPVRQPSTHDAVLKQFRAAKQARRQCLNFTESSRASLVDVGVDVRLYRLESSRGPRSVSPDHGQAPPKRMRRRTPPQMPPSAVPVTLIFQHNRGTFPTCPIKMRPNLPLRRAMDEYARRHSCLVEQLDFRTEAGLMLWDGAADTPAKYGLEDGDRVVVWSAEERKKQARREWNDFE